MEAAMAVAWLLRQDRLLLFISGSCSKPTSPYRTLICSTGAFCTKCADKCRVWERAESLCSTRALPALTEAVIGRTRNPQRSSLWPWKDMLWWSASDGFQMMFRSRGAQTMIVAAGSALVLIAATAADRAHAEG